MGSGKVRFTAARLAAFGCPPGRQQAFLWDATAPGLALRVTAAGARSFVFQSRFDGSSVRITIGALDVWPIAQAQERARELQRLIDEGRDPREVKRAKTEADVRHRAEGLRSGRLVSEVWAAYVEDRTPHWGDRHRDDHEKLARPGGRSAVRGTKGKGVTVAGPLHPMMGLRLCELDASAVDAWAAVEAKKRPTQARLALRLLKAFLAWCSAHPEYRETVNAEAAKSKRAREALGAPKPKNDVLLREQLPTWFAVVRSIPNPAHRVYMEALLLLGCRPGELLDLTWADIDWRWRSITLRDKVEGARSIPLTPRVEELLRGLPRVPKVDCVFASARRGEVERRQAGQTKEQWVVTSRSGRIAHPTEVAARVARAAGLQKLTLHGLRRSFRSLSEWLEVPVGVVAQIQGHKPSATAEKHYTIRPLDLLRVHHERIEAWILTNGQLVAGDGPAHKPPQLRSAA